MQCYAGAGVKGPCMHAPQMGGAAEKPHVLFPSTLAASHHNRRATGPRDDLLSRNPSCGRVGFYA